MSAAERLARLEQRVDEVLNRVHRKWGEQVLAAFEEATVPMDPTEREPLRARFAACLYAIDEEGPG